MSVIIELVGPPIDSAGGTCRHPYCTVALQTAASITEMSESSWLTAYTVRVLGFSVIATGPLPSGVVAGACVQPPVWVTLQVAPLIIATDPRPVLPAGPTSA